MSKFLEHIYNNLIFRNDPQRQDLTDFFTWEFSLIFSSILLKFGKIEEFSALFHNTYFVESNYTTLSPVRFTHFNHDCPYINKVLAKKNLI